MRKIIAQFLMELMCRCPQWGFFGKILLRLLYPLRRTWVAWAHDPVISYNFHKKIININLSHDLPIIRSRYPNYSDNLGDVVSVIASKYPVPSCIDVGANVGDSAVLLRQYADCQVLCIEGEPNYFRLLEHNTSDDPQIIRCQTFVAIGEGKLPGKIVTSRGTAAIMAEPSNIHLSAEELSNILEQFPNFQTAHLLKVDTDGLDSRILKAALSWIEKTNPILFIEYDPRLLRVWDDQPLNLFTDLYVLGYELALVYRNTGEFLFSISLNAEATLNDYHQYLLSTFDEYADLAIFHRRDADLAHRLREHYRQLRSSGLKARL